MDAKSFGKQIDIQLENYPIPQAGQGSVTCSVFCCFSDFAFVTGVSLDLVQDRVAWTVIPIKIALSKALGNFIC